MEPLDILDPPVFLYVKTHNVTGLKYFGRTIKDPFKYKGSGLYWLRHLKAHGNDVATEIVGCYTDLNELKETATKFTKENDIVASSKWANLIAESGLAGVDGWTPSEYQRDVIGEYSRSRWQDPKYKARLSEVQSQVWTDVRKEAHSKAIKELWANPEYRAQAIANKPEVSDETRAKRSKALKGKPKSEETKQRMSLAWKGVPKSEAYREAQSKARTDVHPPINGAVYDYELECYVLPSGAKVQKDSTKHNSWICLENGKRFYSLRAAITELRPDDI